MAQKTIHFKKYSIIKDGVTIKLDLHRFEKQFIQAQYDLDGEVMKSMEPFMPMITGQFIDVTKAASAAIQGSGQVYAAFAPQGRFLYEGKLMVDEVTGSPWARKYARKIVTQIPLRYTGRDYVGQHPQVTDHWFDAAKKKDGKRWVANVKRTAGGGKRG